MLISVLLIALSTGVLSAPNLDPAVTFLQDTAHLLPPTPLIVKPLGKDTVIGLDENVPAHSLKSAGKQKLAEIIGKYITEELKNGQLKEEDISGENSDSKYADIVGMFFKDLLQIPLVFLHAFSDAISRLTASKPAVLVTPVAVPISAPAAPKAAAPAPPAPGAAAPAAPGTIALAPTAPGTIAPAPTAPGAAAPTAPEAIALAPAAPGAIALASAAPVGIAPAPAAPGAIAPAPAAPGAIAPAPAAPGAIAPAPAAPGAIAPAPSALGAGAVAASGMAPATSGESARAFSESPVALPVVVTPEGSVLVIPAPATLSSSTGPSSLTLAAPPSPDPK